MASKLQRLRESIRSKAQRARASARHGVTALEAAGTAGVMGYLRGRKTIGDEEFKIVGVPVDLGVGLALGGLGIYSGSKRGAEDLIAVGIGALCSYTTRTGEAMGAEALATENRTAGVRRVHHLPQGNAVNFAQAVRERARVAG